MVKDKIKKISQADVKSEKDFLEFFNKHHQDVKKQDMSKIERAPQNRRRNILLFVFSLLILILAATLIGFFYFTKENKYTGQGVKIEINVPEKIASGDEVSLDILIGNYEKVDLKLSELTMRFPDGFKFSSSQPNASNEFNNAWDLDTIKSGQENKVIIRGQLLGEVDSHKVFLATLNYVPANFNSEFQTSATKNIIITSSIMELKIESPDAAVNNQDIQIKVTYKNTSVQPLSNVRLRLTYPDGFTYISAQEEPRSGSNNIWQVDSLAENEQREVTINGKITGDTGTMKEIRAELGVMKSDGTFTLQTESYFLLNIIEPTSDLQLTIGNNYEDSVMNWGDTLDCQIKFNNNGSVILNNIELSVTWEQKPKVFIDIASLIDENKGTVSEGGIKWDSTQIEDLKEVRPGQEVVVNFQIKTKNYNDLVIEEGDVDWHLLSQAKAISSKLNDTGASYLQESNKIDNKISTQVTFNAEGRYYDDDFNKVGDGPLPPAVGQRTTYKIYWYIANATSRLQNVTVTTTLPEKSEWQGSGAMTPGGSLDFDPTTRTITWRIEELSAHLGKLLPEATVSFSVSVTPGADDLDKLVVITEPASLEATDSFTQNKIQLTQGLIDSNLENDLAAQDKGIVVNTTIESNNENANFNTNT